MGDAFSVKYPPNVEAFLSQAAEDVGIFAKENYHVDMLYALYEYSTEIKSPIEQMFYVAFKALQLHHDACNEKTVIHIVPQHRIGNYRIDFDITLLDVSKPEYKSLMSAAVELDGHEFHDKDEKQRRYEKRRDRFLQSKGYFVFHFTGKEITDDPYDAASEVLAYLLGEEKDAIHGTYL